MKRPVAPCKKSGRLCERHTVDCKKDCAEWEEYQQAVLAYRDKTVEARNLEMNINSYRAYSISRNNTVRASKASEKARRKK